MALQRNDDITYDFLIKHMEYNPLTGDFKWIKQSGPKARAILNKTIDRKTSHGYLKVQINKKSYILHRLAFLYMTRNFPTKDIDHINHNRSDNRWSNLREVTMSENQQNKSHHKNNTSGRVGVSFDSTNNKWMAFITLSGKSKTLGRFENFNDALNARRKAEKKYKFHVNHGSR